MDYASCQMAASQLPQYSNKKQKATATVHNDYDFRDWKHKNWNDCISKESSFKSIIDFLKYGRNHTKTVRSREANLLCG